MGVLPGFLSPGELQQLQADFHAQQASSPGYYGPPASASVDTLLRPRARTLMRQCAEATAGDWAPTYAEKCIYFATPKSGGQTDIAYHMDHDSFLMHQCHRNYVNLYIYIIKPDPERSGLSLVGRASSS